MKYLWTGLLVFAGWSAGSTYWYVCGVKQLCDNQNIPQKDSTSLAISSDTLLKAESIDTTVLDSPKQIDSIETIKIEKKTPNKTTIQFPSGSINVLQNPDLNTYLDELAEQAKTQNKKIRIEGHTDSDGDEQANYQFGLQRAQTLAQMLVNRGVSNASIIVASEGEKSPIADNSTPEGKQKNRRVEIELQ